MKKVLLITAMLVLLSAWLGAADYRVWFNRYPGYNDALGDALCAAVKAELESSPKIDVVFDDNPDHVFNFGLWTYNPGTEPAKSCFMYEVFFCVKGLPMLYVNSYMEATTEDRMEQTAKYLVNKLLEDADNFYTGYPQYKGKGTVSKE